MNITYQQARNINYMPTNHFFMDSYPTNFLPLLLPANITNFVSQEWTTENRRYDMSAWNGYNSYIKAILSGSIVFFWVTLF